MSASSAPRRLHQTMRGGAADSMIPQKLYILIMGLTGAGKSTFVYTLTENKDIPIGDAGQMHGGKLPLTECTAQPSLTDLSDSRGSGLRTPLLV